MFAAFVSACGGGEDGSGDSTSITSATPPGPTADPTGDPSEGSGGGVPTSGGEGTTGSVDVSTGGTTADEPKLDIGMPDFGGDETGSELGCRFIDVLFVVDISASMSEEKDNLNANFPAFVTVLDEYVADHAAEGYRLGVTNSSIVLNNEGESSFGLDGALFGGDNLLTPDCDLGGNLWIDGPGAGVADTFACLAPLPKSGCNNCTDIGKERPLDAIEMFVEKSAMGGVNEGFYRGQDALFVVILLTDEDDDANNTTTNPAATIAALSGFTGGDSRFVVVTIAGPANDSCDSAFGSAAPAPTLHAFTGMAVNGLIGDICEGDLAQSLAEALMLIQSSCDSLPPPG